MIKIGEFSKLSYLTIKALRFYEKEGILLPAYIDELSGYRFYETSQLVDAAKIKTYRQLDLSIDEIKRIISGEDEKEVLKEKLSQIRQDKKHLENVISSINTILKEDEMKYHITQKTIPAMTVFYGETILNTYADSATWIPELGMECARLNPDFKCSDSCYSFCEYLDGEYKDKDIQVRYNEEVEKKGKGNGIIKFRKIPETKVISIFHKGSYSKLAEAYAYIFNYAEKNNYKINGVARECYIDGSWNKDSEDEWLTEIQIPVE